MRIINYQLNSFLKCIAYFFKLNFAIVSINQNLLLFKNMLGCFLSYRKKTYPVTVSTPTVWPHSTNFMLPTWKAITQSLTSLKSSERNILFRISLLLCLLSKSALVNKLVCYFVFRLFYYVPLKIMVIKLMMGSTVHINIFIF